MSKIYELAISGEVTAHPKVKHRCSAFYEVLLMLHCWKLKSCQRKFKEMKRLSIDKNSQISNKHPHILHLDFISSFSD